MKKLLFRSMLVGLGAFALASCGNEDNPAPDTPGVAWIPGDDKADPNPEVENPNATIPNFQYSVESENGTTIVRIDLTGIQNPNDVNDWLKLYGTNTSLQNVWVSVDGLPKGFTITNTIDETDQQVSAVDLVFLVDNSGSMSEEANAIARDIVSWSDKLSQTLDMRFGCVGYDGAITGAMNLSTVTELNNYLNRNGYYGTSRTCGFAGDDAATLQGNTSIYATGGGSWNECGAAALRFADENFKFRAGANRLYVNFTDEPNQPNGNEAYSTEWVKNPDNWPSVKGTIHTVYSDTYINWTERILWEEKPWMLSDYTGGTFIATNSSFSGVTLESLPVTGALQNSYIIKFTNCENLFDGQPHTVKITILSPDGTVRAEREITVTFNR